MPVFILPQDGSDRVVTFDVIESENHESVSELSDHPVEVGINITDHVRPVPDTFSLVGFITNTPIRFNPFTGRGEIKSFKLEVPEYFPTPEQLLTSPGGALRFGGGALADYLFPTELSATVLAFPDFFDAVRETYEVLQDLQKNAVTIRLLTNVREYQDMIIVRTAMPRVVGQATGASFQVDLRQLRVVEVGAVAAPPVPIAAVPGGIPNAPKGAQAPTPPAVDEDAEKPKSLALQILQGAGILQ